MSPQTKQCNDTNKTHKKIPIMLMTCSLLPVPQLLIVEENIVVYIARYMGEKASKKFTCLECECSWQEKDEASETAYTFINNKQ